jgi:hypothetical protein
LNHLGDAEQFLQAFELYILLGNIADYRFAMGDPRYG